MGAEEGDALVHGIVSGWRGAGLSAEDLALCEFASKLTRNPADMSPQDLDRLRAAGFDDRAIHDATQVAGFFNYITRIADGLGVEPETFIDEWGRVDA
ncbi:MAG: peroxidase [Gemmatimonadota bacterium]|nr:peroxidase [Gemmatimonadota bacterium]